jgi:predicted amidohydrolase YtcJ
VHFIDGGLGLDRIDLADAGTLEIVQARIRAWANANPDRPWVVGRGWRAEAFEGAQPTRQALDAIVPDRPAFLTSADGHAAWVNSKALRLGRIGRRTPDPANGVIVKDRRTGEPTGVLHDAAMALAGKLVPPASREERTRALRAAMAEAQRLGITSIQDAGATLDDLGLYDDFRRAGDLNLRVYAAVVAPGPPGELSDAQLDRLEGVRNRYPDDPLFKTGVVKLTIDEPIALHTAAVLEASARKPLASEPLVASDDLNRLARVLDARGWQLMSDASGDRAVRMALNAYEHAARSNTTSARGRRHRIEHVAIVEPEDVARFGALAVIASVQPFTGSPDPGPPESIVSSLGEDRPTRLWPLRSLLSGGGKLVFGSDWPSEPLDPLLAIHAAVNRTTPDGIPEGGSNSAERISLRTAIDAYTSEAAYASFDEQRKGSLRAGMLADLVVLSADIFSTPSSELASTTVAMTIFDGNIVYRKNTKLTN